MVTILQGFEEDGFQVSMGQAVALVCRGQAQSVLPANQDCLDSRSGFGSANQGADRTGRRLFIAPWAGLRGMNKHTEQRIFQLKGWQVRKRASGHRPRIQALGMKTLLRRML